MSNALFSANILTGPEGVHKKSYGDSLDGGKIMGISNHEEKKEVSLYQNINHKASVKRKLYEKFLSLSLKL